MRDQVWLQWVVTSVGGRILTHVFVLCKGVRQFLQAAAMCVFSPDVRKCDMFLVVVVQLHGVCPGYVSVLGCSVVSENCTLCVVMGVHGSVTTSLMYVHGGGLTDTCLCRFRFVLQDKQWSNQIDAAAQTCVIWYPFMTYGVQSRSAAFPGRH